MSTGCSEASGLRAVSDPLTSARAAHFKDGSLSHAGRCDSMLQMMSNYQQNMRMFIWDRTGGFGRREWLRVRMEENGEGCMVTFRSLG